MSFKDELKEVCIKEKEYLDSIDPEKQKELFKVQMNRVAEIEKQLIDYEKKEIEIEEKAASRDMDEQFKYRQMEEDRKSQKTKNRIEVAKIAVPTVAAMVTGIAVTILEHSEIVASIAAKASFRDLIRFRN